MALVEITNLSVQKGGRQLLRNVSLRIESGEVVALMGPNGAGKTTLLRTILGLSPAAARGAVQLDGNPLEDLSPRAVARLVGYVPQRVTVSFPYTVRQFLEMSLYPVEGATEREPSLDTAVAQTLEVTRTEPLALRRLTELSGGELQRVVLASALVQRPKVLLLDEAAASLDPKNALVLHQVIEQLVVAQALGVLLVSHDINTALGHSSRIIGMKAGEIKFDGSPAQCIAESILEELFDVPFERLSGGTGILVVPRV